MSDQGSNFGTDDMPRRRSLPTEELGLTGNPNPMGVPFFRYLPLLGLDEQQREERASLLGSQQYVFQSSGSDTCSGDIVTVSVYCPVREPARNNKFRLLM